MEHQRGKVIIGCDVIAADKLSEKLVSMLPPALHGLPSAKLRLGWREMLINAIEHGSLEIGFERKSVETAGMDYLEFLLKRQKDPEYAGRTVEVEYHISPRKAIFRISDQGRGFDHKHARSTAQQGENDLDLAHGRGIRMTLRIFDKVRYNEKGNRVTLLKKYGAATQSAQAS